MLIQFRNLRAVFLVQALLYFDQNEFYFFFTFFLKLTLLGHS